RYGRGRLDVRGDLRPDGLLSRGLPQRHRLESGEHGDRLLAPHGPAAAAREPGALRRGPLAFSVTSVSSVVKSALQVSIERTHENEAALHGAGAAAGGDGDRAGGRYRLYQHDLQPALAQ